MQWLFHSSLSLCATEQLAILEKVKVIFWLVKFGLCIRPTHRMEKASLQYGIIIIPQFLPLPLTLPHNLGMPPRGRKWDCSVCGRRRHTERRGYRPTEGGTIHICLAEKEGREGRGNEQGLLSPQKERKLQLSLFKILKVLVLSFSSLEVPLFFLSFFLLC